MQGTGVSTITGIIGNAIIPYLDEHYRIPMLQLNHFKRLKRSLPSDLLTSWCNVCDTIYYLNDQKHTQCIKHNSCITTCGQEWCSSKRCGTCNEYLCSYNINKCCMSICTSCSKQCVVCLQVFCNNHILNIKTTHGYKKCIQHINVCNKCKEIKTSAQYSCVKCHKSDSYDNMIIENTCSNYCCLGHLHCGRCAN